MTASRFPCLLGCTVRRLLIVSYSTLVVTGLLVSMTFLTRPQPEEEFWSPEEVPTGLWGPDSDRNLSHYVRPQDLTALILPPADSQERCSPFLLVLVQTAVESRSVRATIRSTWGSGEFTGGPEEAVVRFVVGRTPDLDVMQAVRNEAELNGDILQEDFIDDYSNLTIKSTMSLKWAFEFCRPAFILKCDEDMFINIPNIISYLRQLGHPMMILGSMTHRSEVIRDSDSRYYTPRYMYPWDVYPRYASGTAYVLGSQVAGKIYSQALQTRLFHLEDVFLTGICGGQVVGAVLVHHDGFRRYRRQEPKVCFFRRIMSFHKINSLELQRIWDDIQRVHREGGCLMHDLILDGWPMIMAMTFFFIFSAVVALTLRSCRWLRKDSHVICALD